MATRRKPVSQRKPKIEVGLTPARRAKALSAYSRQPIHARVAEHLGVDVSTLRLWRAKHPDFAAEMDNIKDEWVQETGELAEEVVRKTLREAADGTPTWHETDTKSGQVVRLEAERPYPAHAVRAALTKHDPDYVRVPLTHDEQDKVQGFINELLAARK